MTTRYKAGLHWDEAVAISAPVFSAPFPGRNIFYVLTQQFMQQRDAFEPLALDTSHADFSDYGLVLESPQQDAKGDLIIWTRTYAKTPDNYVESGGNYAYNFIGFYGSFGINTTSVTGRERFTRNVEVELTREFFRTANFETIPVIPIQRYYFGSNPNVDVNYIADSPPLAEPTTPNRTDYEALIAANAFNIVTECRITRWLGNIWMRETFRVKAL